MMPISVSTPYAPRFVIVNVPAVISSGRSAPPFARATRSFASRAICDSGLVAGVEDRGRDQAVVERDGDADVLLRRAGDLRRRRA